MAGSIKGITIEFRGDTTRLDQALRQINNETKNIDKELRNVDKALKFTSRRKGATRLPSPEEKAIVQQAAAGIAKFNKNGTEVDTSVGFRNAGYAELKGKMVPIPKIVNAINSGTSFMRKQPFVRQAARSGASKAIEAMKTAIEAEFEALTK